MAAASGHTLERANATLRGMNVLASLVGPVIVGVVVGVFGSPAAVLLKAIAGGFTAVTLAFFLPVPARAARAARAEATATDGQSYYQRFRVAMRFLWCDRPLRALITATAVFAALDTGLASIGLTAYASEQLGSPAWYGGLVSSFGAGALAGTIGYGIVGHRIPRRGVYIGAYLAFAVLVLLLAAQTGVPVALMVMFVAGLVIGPVHLLYMLVPQERVPERMFGHATRIATTVVSGPSPLGFLC